MRIADEAIDLAAQWQNRANRLLTPEEKDVQEQLGRLLGRPSDRVLLARMIDRCFRCRDEGRVADQIHYLFREYGVPDFFSSGDKILSRLFMGIGRHFPAVSVPRVIERMREESSRSVIPGEPDALRQYLRKRKAEGARVNVNLLGEAVLGEKEALGRLAAYVKTLEDPDIEHVSVKISTLCSRIEPLAFELTVNVLRERLSVLYRAAAENAIVHEDGSRTPKLVHLDMEQYRDLAITAEVFRRTLDAGEFRDLSAGIALQAYLPDSHQVQRELTRWARKRVAAGGAPVKIRIVKGANLEMERVEASLRGWPLAPYDNKLAVDANYKRMVEFGMVPENIRAVRLGVASHNLFELAYAYLLARENEVTQYFSFEMLEGMADHVRRALAETSVETLVYAPVATREGFVNAIAYLMRRLDENTSEENFLRHSPGLKPDTPPWETLKEKFTASLRYRDRAGAVPHRVQDRSAETFAPRTGTLWDGLFFNEPDTDFSLGANRKWAEAVRGRWKKNPGQSPMEIPVVAGGREIFAGRKHREIRDRSQAESEICPARYAMADESDMENAVLTARTDPDGWRSLSPEKRHRILSEAAAQIRKHRGDLIGAAAAETGKVFFEADPEVSEAVDFTELYPLSVNAFCGMENLRCRGKGVGLVVSPWNFPISIPASGISASLAAGNTVIFKPSSEAVLTGWVLCRCFWSAGVPQTALQFVPCAGSAAGSRLTGHPGVDFVILTGGTETGLSILAKRPGLYLAAETGGKNATIVTAMSDRDQAIGNVIRSAFGNSGQKCSATSLLILEKEVYEDPHFKNQIKDAAQSIRVGSAWDFENRMGPLIREPEGKLKQGMEALEPGESWLLKPENIGGNPYLWTPGIKWGVQPGSFTHMTELFGPVLAVMCADDLDHAIELANQTGYGLTSGLESLDPREQEKWKAEIAAGNLYINRPTTGAVVLRQPFGGMGKSALGPGIKVGGPNYVAQLMEFEETGPPPAGAVRTDHPLLGLAREWERKLFWGGFAAQWAHDLARTVRAMKSYVFRAEEEFFPQKDYFHLRGQDNILRYLPVGTVVVRIHEKDGLFEVLARIAAAKTAGCSPMVSIPPSLANGVLEFLEGTDGKKIAGDIPVLRQTDEALAGSIAEIHRIRYAAPDRVPDMIFRKAAETGFYISRVPVTMEGRIELLHYFREQSVCDEYHRYGNLGERA